MHTQLPLTAWLILAAIGYAAYYSLACWLFPFGRCRRCKGAGKLASPSGRHFRLCRRCKHTGLRLRLGRKAYNWLRHMHHDATGGVR